MAKEPKMKKQFTVTYRIWHWMMALSTIGLLLTVLLRKTFLSWRANSEIIQTQLAQLATEITAESAKVVAKAIRAPMWEWHYIFAVVLGLSIALRIYMILTKQAELPIITFLKSSATEKLKVGTHMLLCFSIAIMAISGALIYFHEFLTLTKDTTHSIKKFHEFIMQPLILFVIMHWFGVLRHELITKEGIISKMIHGD
jgi:cytochrome b561